MAYGGAKSWLDKNDARVNFLINLTLGVHLLNLMEMQHSTTEKNAAKKKGYLDAFNYLSRRQNNKCIDEGVMLSIRRTIPGTEMTLFYLKDYFIQQLFIVTHRSQWCTKHEKFTNCYYAIHWILSEWCICSQADGSYLLICKQINQVLFYQRRGMLWLWRGWKEQKTVKFG